MDNELRETLIVILRALRGIAGNTPGFDRLLWEALLEEIHKLELLSAVAKTRRDDAATADTP